MAELREVNKNISLFEKILGKTIAQINKGWREGIDYFCDENTRDFIATIEEKEQILTWLKNNLEQHRDFVKKT